ncbi:DBH-like monooxygenase protein 1 [Seminavis robusta]|uniref:DBH-like monooxygenase protein 1 n=1 Tax=Seminavis robusta TaxID=568900 RepID=A0A9N8EHE6_9STRA|nr:DBH-like monooxygenase protein 1 [Seminavis robusta]|eukprot:Sro1194_g251290.1 DBH-like monooxygenase protein 1 (702) ;mRNA; r:14461-17071
MKITALLSLVASLALPVSRGLQIADNPPTYFGAVNNAAYLTWLSNQNIETRYDNSVYMPSIDQASGAAVHWRVDEEYIHLAVAARASGWLGFGFSDAGGMFGSDMALFSINNPGKIVDAYVVEVPYPQEDSCQHDWVYVNASAPSLATAISRSDSRFNPEAIEGEESEEFVMFETRRKLVTDDAQDIQLIRDSLIAVPETRIIAAWGDTPDVSFHGTSVARGSIRLFKQDVEIPDFHENMNRNADGSFFVGSNRYIIPENSTTYEDFCFTRSDLISQGVPNTTDMLSIIGFDPVVDDGPSAPFIHHYIVTGIYNASDNACDNGAGLEMVFAWAPGDGGFALPEFLGANLFGEDGFQAFNIEIHYDNPRMQRDVVDNSGIRIYYTTTPRPVEMGIFQVGDPMVALFGQHVGDGLSSHHFDCPGSCSDLYLSDGEPVTVIREYLHMHIAGTRTTNEHIRNGTVIRTAATEVWDFDQNGNVPVKQDPYEIHPGDSFRTSCFYRGNQDTVFGLASQEEMCMAFLYYYPRKVFKVEIPEGSFTLPMMCGYQLDWLDNACFANYTQGGILESDDDLGRHFGKQNSECYLGTDAIPQVSVDVETPAAESGSSLRGTPAPSPIEEDQPVAATAQDDAETQPAPEEAETAVAAQEEEPEPAAQDQEEVDSIPPPESFGDALSATASVSGVSAIGYRVGCFATLIMAYLWI